MQMYECPECGSVKLAKDWAYCNDHKDSISMYEVMSYGSNGLPPQAAKLLELANVAKTI